MTEVSRVFFDLKKLLAEYKIDCHGILHVGGHEAQELELYKRVTDRRLWVEPNPKLAKQIRDKGERVEEVIAWDGEVLQNFYVTKNSQGSSALKPLEHEVDDELTLPTQPLRDFVGGVYNVLVVDTQGSELKVLQGANLGQFDMIICEVSNRIRYEGAATKDQIVEYLQDFQQVKSYPHDDGTIEDLVFVKKRMTTKILIPCAGSGSRWSGFMGIPKYMAEVDGVPIIEGLVGRLQQYDATITIIGEPRVKGAENYLPEYSSDEEVEKFTSSRKLWNDNGRTVFLFGDTYFTDEALKEIMEYPEADWVFFGRPFGSKFTGKPYGEIYAFSFYDGHISLIDKSVRRIQQLEKFGWIDRTNGWSLYRAMMGIPDEIMNRHLVGDNFVNIDDFTEDFDYPIDYTRLIENKNGK